MLTVAVTGGIGSGKSTVAALLADLGAVVVDSDQLARDVVAPGTAGLMAVAEQFGAGVLAADGSLDRAAMARIVFADPDARLRLEAIVHPLVRAAFHRARQTAGPGAIVVNDIPLVRTLAEAAAFHLVIGVGAPEELRIRRLARRGMPESDARARMSSQIGDDVRRDLADIWIDNAGDEAALQAIVCSLWERRLVPFQQNLTAGRVAPEPDVERAGRPGRPDRAGGADRAGRAGGSAPSDRSALVRLLCTRVAVAAGGLPCLPLEPVEGSVAQPGPVAADAIELQLAVADLVTADRVAPALAAAGFPQVAGEQHDPGGADRWLAGDRRHGNADPGQPLNLYLKVKL